MEKIICFEKEEGLLWLKQSYPNCLSFSCPCLVFLGWSDWGLRRFEETSSKEADLEKKLHLVKCSIFYMDKS